MSNKQLEEYLLEVVDRDGWTSGRQPRHVDMDNNCTSNSRIEHMLKTLACCALVYALSAVRMSFYLVAAVSMDAVAFVVWKRSALCLYKAGIIFEEGPFLARSKYLLILQGGLVSVLALVILFAVCRLFLIRCLVATAVILATGMILSAIINTVCHKTLRCQRLSFSMLLFIKKVQLSGLSMQLTHPLPPITLLQENLLNANDDDHLFDCKQERNKMLLSLRSIQTSIRQLDHFIGLKRAGARSGNESSVSSGKVLSKLARVVLQHEILSSLQRIISLIFPNPEATGYTMDEAGNVDYNVEPVELFTYFSKVDKHSNTLQEVLRNILQVDIRRLRTMLGPGILNILKGFSGLMTLQRILSACEHQLNDSVANCHLDNENRESDDAVCANGIAADRLPVQQLGNDIVRHYLQNKLDNERDNCLSKCDSDYLELRSTLLQMRHRLESAAYRVWECEKLLSHKEVAGFFMDPIIGQSCIVKQELDAVNGGSCQVDKMYVHTKTVQTVSEKLVSALRTVTANDVDGGTSLSDVLCFDDLCCEDSAGKDENLSIIRQIDEQMRNLLEVVNTIQLRSLLLSSVSSVEPLTGMTSVVQQGDGRIIREGNDLIALSEAIKCTNGATRSCQSSLTMLTTLDPDACPATNREVNIDDLINSDASIDVFVGQVTEAEITERESALRKEILAMRQRQKASVGADDSKRKNSTTAVMRELSALVSARSVATKAREKEQTQVGVKSVTPVTLDAPDKTSTDSNTTAVVDVPVAATSSSMQKMSNTFLSILEQRKAVNDALYTLGDSDEEG
jgi:hypothetical protein